MPRSYKLGDEPVPGHRLLKFLGRGGFGEVWQATAPGGVEVAFKIISLGDKTGYKEFRAIQRVKRIRHPNLVPMLSIWLRDDKGNIIDELPPTDRPIADPSQPIADELMIAMGLGDKSLLDRFKECKDQGLQGIPGPELINYIEDAARAIDHLNSPKHDLGSGPVAIQHCDIKPQNILIVGNAAQVCDFGLARVTGENRSTNNPAVTLAFAAPEMLEDGKPGPHTDQYSLALTYYFLRTGALPFSRNDASTIILEAIEGRLDLSRLNPTEQEVIRRAVHRKEANRYPTCVDMARELRRAMETGGAAKPVKLVIEPGSEIVPGHKLVKLLGRGAYGEVWETLAPGRIPVALKIIKDLDRAGGRGRQEFRALEIIQRVSHSHLMELRSYWLLDKQGHIIPDDARGQPGAPPAATLIIATKLAERNLTQVLEEYQAKGIPAIPVKELLGYIRQVASALDYLNTPRHKLGDKKVSIQHRDVKPDNIMLADDSVKLTDFGLAKVLEMDDITADIHQDSVGFTFHYVAPEVLQGKVTRWSDQYSLAITYYYLRTGVLPFERAGSVYDLMMQQMQGRLDLSCLPDPERRVLYRATEVDPTKRYPNCMAFVEALEAAMPADGSIPVTGGTPRTPGGPQPSTDSPVADEPTTPVAIAGATPPFSTTRDRPYLETKSKPVEAPVLAAAAGPKPPPPLEVFADPSPAPARPAPPPKPTPAPPREPVADVTPRPKISTMTSGPGGVAIVAQQPADPESFVTMPLNSPKVGQGPKAPPANIADLPGLVPADEPPRVSPAGRPMTHAAINLEPFPLPPDSMIKSKQRSETPAPPSRAPRPAPPALADARYHDELAKQEERLAKPLDGAADGGVVSRPSWRDGRPSAQSSVTLRPLSRISRRRKNTRVFVVLAMVFVVGLLLSALGYVLLRPRGTDLASGTGTPAETIPAKETAPQTKPTKPAEIKPSKPVETPPPPPPPPPPPATVAGVSVKDPDFAQKLDDVIAKRWRQPPTTEQFDEAAKEVAKLPEDAKLTLLTLAYYAEALVDGGVKNLQTAHDLLTKAEQIASGTERPYAHYVRARYLAERKESARAADEMAKALAAGAMDLTGIRLKRAAEVFNTAAEQTKFPVAVDPANLAVKFEPPAQQRAWLAAAAKVRDLGEPVSPRLNLPLALVAAQEKPQAVADLLKPENRSRLEGENKLLVPALQLQLAKTQEKQGQVDAALNSYAAVYAALAEGSLSRDFQQGTMEIYGLVIEPALKLAARRSDAKAPHAGLAMLYAAKAVVMLDNKSERWPLPTGQPVERAVADLYAQAIAVQPKLDGKNPALARYHYGRGVALAELLGGPLARPDDLKTIRQSAEAALEADKGYPGGWNLQGFLLLTANDTNGSKNPQQRTDEAIEAFGEALARARDLRPNHELIPDILANRSRAYIDKAHYFLSPPKPDTAKAQDYFQRALKDATDATDRAKSSETAWLARGIAAEDVAWKEVGGDPAKYPEAEKCFREYLRLCGKPAGKINLGRCLVKWAIDLAGDAGKDAERQRLLREAEALLTTVTRDEAKNADGWFWLGRLQLLQNNWSGAKTSWVRMAREAHEPAKILQVLRLIEKNPEQVGAFLAEVLPREKQYAQPWQASLYMQRAKLLFDASVDGKAIDYGSVVADLKLGLDLMPLGDKQRKMAAYHASRTAENIAQTFAEKKDVPKVFEFTRHRVHFLYEMVVSDPGDSNMPGWAKALATESEILAKATDEAGKPRAATKERLAVLKQAMEAVDLVAKKTPERFDQKSLKDRHNELKKLYDEIEAAKDDKAK